MKYKKVSKINTNILIFYDGNCGMCDIYISFLFSRDKQHVFRFAPLQGATAKKNLPENYCKELNTIVVLVKDRMYIKSNAIIKALKILGGVNAFIAIFIALTPRLIRDKIYTLVASNRNNLFRQSCRYIRPEEKHFFLK